MRGARHHPLFHYLTLIFFHSLTLISLYLFLSVFFYLGPHHLDIIFNGNPVKKSSFTKNIWVCFLIVHLILMNILKEYLIKLVNLLVLFASSEIFYRDHLFYKFINLLLDLT